MTTKFSDVNSAEGNSDSCSSNDALAVYVNRISNALYEPKNLKQERTKIHEDSKSNGEEIIKEVEVDEITTLFVSESSKERRESVVKNSLNSSYKQEKQCLESLEHDQSLSFSNKQRQNNATQSRKVLDSADSLKEQTLVEKHCCGNVNGVQANVHDTKDAQQVVRIHFSQKDDQLQVLEKVDELKIELHRMLSNKSAGNEASSFSIKVTHFEEKIESNDDKSSSFGLIRQPNYYCCLNESQIRHCRPVSGGAPFVICYKCYKLLQLPADFLVSAKRIHKLRCGYCSEVLVYSFKPKSRSAISSRDFGNFRNSCA